MKTTSAKKRSELACRHHWLLIIIVLLTALLFIGCSSIDTGTPSQTGESQVVSQPSVTPNPATPEPSESAVANTPSPSSDPDSFSATQEPESQEDDEAQKQADEEARKQAEEARKQAEEEAKEQAEEETRKQAEEEARKQAEEAARKQAEEEARKQAEEERVKKEQQQSFSMMYYLAITAEEIRTSKDNRLVLDEIYTSLLNDINPGAVDEITQEHLKNLRDIIKSYLQISTKRERLQFIYNQNKAAAIRSAVPNPLAILSMTKSLNWKQLALSAVYTAVDSYTNYKSASENADTEFLMSGWELDDEEVAAVQKNRDRAFDYMVDMVQAYGLDGMLTLNEKAIERFAEICRIESVHERIRRLVSEEKTYQLLGNYWLELADCYFETSQYSKCIECVEKYNELATGIYRQDYNYLQILPKVIVAAQSTYTGEQYITTTGKYADAIMDNTSSEDWSMRYFAAQVYIDLYSRTGDAQYLTKAYWIAYDNVTVLLKEQRELNNTYLSDVKEVTITEPDYRFMNDKEKKEKQKEFKEEQKKLKSFNKANKEKRKTELPSLYEPLVVNCELLFALAKEMNISVAEQAEIEAILATSTNGIFLTCPINDAYSFSGNNKHYSVEMSKDELIIPANLLTAGSTITVTVDEDGKQETFEDCEVSKVERKGDTIDTFLAHVTSKTLKKHKWTANSKITIHIIYGDAYDRSIQLEFYVSEFAEHWYGNKVVFTQK